METVRLLDVSLKIETIIIGEQFKGGTFRPCVETIPSSTIEGAFFHHFGIAIPAVGMFIADTYEVKEFAYSVHDKYSEMAKVPLSSMYLAPSGRDGTDMISATIYVPYAERYRTLLEGAEFRMGALRNKGFGKCKITEIREESVDTAQGLLNVRLFEDEIAAFAVTVISPNYGYLFRLHPPRPGESNNDPKKTNLRLSGGVFRRALFEGSLVEAPTVLLQKELTYYDI